MLTEVFRVWNGNIPSPYGKTVTGSGNTVTLPGGVNGLLFSVANIEKLNIDVNLITLRGVGAGFAFSYSRTDAFGNLYQVASGSLNGAGQAIMDIGPGLATPNNPGGQQGQFAWTVSGASYNTTVTTGANSATQQVGSTTNMIVGDTLHFVTANVDRTVLSITDGTHIVLSSAVNSTTGETVNVTSTPSATFTAFGEGK